MVILLVTAVFAVMLVAVAAASLRRRDPLLGDVTLVFASVAGLFLLGLLRLLAGDPPRTVTAAFTALLLAQPLFAVRLVRHLRAVPGWATWAAAAVWAGSTTAVATADTPYPDAVRYPVVALFFAIDAAAAGALAVEARRRAGAAKARLWWAATGTALLGVAPLSSVVVAPDTAAGRLVATGSALAYLLAFLPPRWLRQVWSQGAAYALARRLLHAPADNSGTQTWQRYCRGAAALLGADHTMVLLPSSAGPAEPVSSAGIVDRRYDRRDVDALLAGPATADAADPHAPRVAVDAAADTGTRYATAAALPYRGRPGGGLLLLHRRRTLFTDDDLALFAQVATQAETLADRAEAARDRERLAAIVESSHDAIIGKTIDGVITSWNAGAQRLYGYRADEVLGRHASFLFSEDQRDTEADFMARIAHGERIEGQQVRRRRRSGAAVTVSLTLSPITDRAGRVVGVSSVSRDIGERQRADAMFQGLLEAAPDALIGVDRSGVITLVNAQAERLFGYQRDELLGQLMERLVPQRVRTAHPRHRDHYFAHPQTREMGGGTALSAVRKDGTEFPAEISLSALETEQGTIVMTATRDVTDRQEAQAERERLAAQAERDAAERRLAHTRRLESLGQLAGGVAHDFNNLLGVITSYAELLADTLTTDTLDTAGLEAARADITQITRAADRAAALTKQLLAFGRREITQPEVLCLNHLIGQVEQMLRRTLGGHITLLLDQRYDLWQVCADASQIEQILLNLAINARDAMPGGGTLTIDTTNVHLDDDTHPDLPPGGYVRLRVSDTGTGMPADVAERAFEPFFTTKPPGAGTGLGLATVYGIAAAAAGTVRLHSQPGIGTTVTVLLPATADRHRTPTAAADRPASGERPPQQRTILLVDDEDALRHVTHRILTRAGYQVLAAAGGAEALHLAATADHHVDLLLTDVIMPSMMGNEVAERLHATHPHLPVLYMSGYAQPVLTENGTLPPGVTIIEKPFTGHELLDRIHTLLHHTAPAHP